MDFLVNPSTFSDAEMADILMPKTSDELMYPPGEIKGFLFWSYQYKNMKPADRMSTLAQFRLIPHFPTWSHDAGVTNPSIDCFRIIRFHKHVNNL